MKKSIFISFIFVLGIAGSAMAQHVSFVASFGSPRAWNVPDVVSRVVYHDYYQYDWVHASRVVDHGQLSFNVLLQRGNTFLELNIGRFGHVRQARSFDYYPLGGHICSAHCGYHEYYYNSFNSVCNSHHHMGHNHVVFRPMPANYVWGHYHKYPKYQKVYYNTKVVYKDGHHKGNKSYKGTYDDNNKKKSTARRSYPQRRQGTFKELERTSQQRQTNARTSSSTRNRTQTRSDSKTEDNRSAHVRTSTERNSSGHYRKEEDRKKDSRAGSTSSRTTRRSGN